MMGFNKLVNIFNDVREHGLDAVDDFDFDEALYEAHKIFKLIEKYVNKHGNISLACGGEWMYQDDDGQVDALELVSDILDNLSDYAEPEDDE